MSANPRSIAGEYVEEDRDVGREEAMIALGTISPLHDLTTDAKWEALEDWLTRQEWAEIERLTRAESSAAMVRCQAKIALLREIRNLPALTRLTVSQLNDALGASEGDDE